MRADAMLEESDLDGYPLGRFEPGCLAGALH
jgi:hypothetical protein